MSLEIVSDREQRRINLTSWLLRAWEWATDTGNESLACKLAVLVNHASESDYPLLEKARQCGVIGDTALADRLRNILGLPPQTLERTGWEREINFSPVITLDPEMFQRIYNALGWVNRAVDPKYPRTNFWLWSDAANLVRFVRREPVKEVESE